MTTVRLNGEVVVLPADFAAKCGLLCLYLGQELVMEHPEFRAADIGDLEAAGMDGSLVELCRRWRTADWLNHEELSATYLQHVAERLARREMIRALTEEERQAVRNLPPDLAVALQRHLRSEGVIRYPSFQHAEKKGAPIFVNVTSVRGVASNSSVHICSQFIENRCTRLITTYCGLVPIADGR